MVRILLALAIVLLAPAVRAEIDTTLKVGDAGNFVSALIQVENPDLDPHKIGDRGLYFKAHGLLQIRQPYLDDVNRIAGPSQIQKLWGKKKLTLADMKVEAKAIWAMKVYVVHYGKVYEEKTGKKVSEKVYARIHNGGPTGYLKWCTKKYWEMVQVAMAMNNDADTVNHS